MKIYTVVEILETNEIFAEVIDVEAFSDIKKAFERMNTKYCQMLDTIESTYKDSETFYVEKYIDNYSAEIHVYPYGIDNEDDYIVHTYSIDEVRVREQNENFHCYSYV